jgi:hypothetical protein
MPPPLIHISLHNELDASLLIRLFLDKIIYLSFHHAKLLGLYHQLYSRELAASSLLESDDEKK